MADFITIRLESIPPSTNALYSNRSQYGKRGRTYTDDYKLWKQIAGVEIMAQRVAWPVKSIKGAFGICAIWPYNGKRDLDNYWKSTLDLLKNMGVIENDNKCVMQTGFKSKAVKEAIIVLRPFDMEQIQAEIQKTFSQQETQLPARGPHSPW